MMSVDMENEVEDMCNLSQGIVEDTTREVTRKVTKEVTKKKTVEYINLNYSSSIKRSHKSQFKDVLL